MKKITLILTLIVSYAFVFVTDADAQVLVRRSSNGEPYFKNKATVSRNNHVVNRTNRKYYSRNSYNRPVYYRHDNGKHKGWYKHKKLHKKPHHSPWRRK